jgi:hypothetical protein
MNADHVSCIEVRELSWDRYRPTGQALTRQKTAGPVVDSEDRFVSILNCAPQVIACPHNGKVGSRAGWPGAERL